MNNPFSDIDWEQWRREDGSIRVTDILLSTKAPEKSIGVHYLRDVEQVRPIKSRQLAATLLINAVTFEAFAWFMISDVSKLFSKH